MTFLEYVDKKQREGIRQLEIIKRILRTNDLQVASHLQTKLDDPFLFVYNPESGKFGVRVYKIGNDIVYRIQKKEKTQPYGRARILNVEETYDGIKLEKKKDEATIKELINSIGSELKEFFKKSIKAEKEDRDDSDGPLGKIGIPASAINGDYSNKVFSPSRS